MTKLKELLFMNELRGVGKVKINKYLDSIKGISDLQGLKEMLLVNEKIPEEEIVSAQERAEQKYYRLLQESDLKVVTVFDPEYPKGFMDLGNKKPVILYAKGDISVLNRPGISVVGTRKPSAWTSRFGENISKQMGQISGRIIVSGLALGCDAFAHRGALKAGVPTIAVLPSGVNKITPASHTALAEEIVKNGGCLISEYAPDTNAFKTFYVERDKLIAAMTDITYVIECDEKSGTMHTVKAAHELGRQLACYYPSDEHVQKGADLNYYPGNRLMIEKMGAVVVAGEDELRNYFAALDSRFADTNREEPLNNPHQTTIFEFLQDEE